MMLHSRVGSISGFIPSPSTGWPTAAHFAEGSISDRANKGLTNFRYSPTVDNQVPFKPVTASSWKLAA
jgi:hypothetical protein